MLRDGLCLLSGWQWPWALGRQGTEPQGLEMPAEGDGLADAFAAAVLHLAQALNSTSHDAGHPVPSNSPTLG